MLTTFPALKPALASPVELIEDEIAKYESWLEVPSVIASGHWVDEINVKLDRPRGQLTAARRPVTHRR